MIQRSHLQRTNDIQKRFVLTRQTAHILLNIAERETRNTLVLYFSRLIVRNLLPRDQISEALAILSFVRQHIRYQTDPPDIEVVFGPVEVLKILQKYGFFSEDCETQAILVYSLLRAIGHKPRLICAGFTPNSDKLDHIFIQDLIRNTWLVLDPSLDPKTSLYMLKKATWIEIYSIF